MFLCFKLGLETRYLSVLISRSLFGVAYFFLRGVFGICFGKRLSVSDVRPNLIRYYALVGQIFRRYFRICLDERVVFITYFVLSRLLRLCGLFAVLCTFTFGIEFAALSVEFNALSGHVVVKAVHSFCTFNFDIEHEVLDRLITGKLLHPVVKLVVLRRAFGQLVSDTRVVHALLRKRDYFISAHGAFLSKMLESERLRLGRRFRLRIRFSSSLGGFAFGVSFRLSCGGFVFGIGLGRGSFSLFIIQFNSIISVVDDRIDF